MRRTQLCILVFALAIAIPVRADETDTGRAIVEEILQLTKTDQMMRTMQDEMKKMMVSQLESLEFEGKETAEFREEFEEVFSSIFTDDLWKRMRDPLIDVYLKVYSTQELAELRDFYRSPLGQKMIAKLPEVMRESMKVGQEVMQDLIPQIEAKVKALVEKVQKG